MTIYPHLCLVTNYHQLLTLEATEMLSRSECVFVLHSQTKRYSLNSHKYKNCMTKC